MSLVLYSGLAADEQVFTPQSQCFPELIVPRWLIPESTETLDHYARRMSDGLAQLPRPLHLGGASFGGILALHAARYVQPDSVILIGSIRSPDELPRYAKLARPLRGLVPYFPVRPWQMLLAPIVMALTKRSAPRLHGLAAQMRRADPRVIRWSVRRLLDWQVIPEVNCPVHHIHGQRDSVLPVRYTHPDKIIPGGGHIVSLTHPEEVNAYLRRILNVKPT